MDIAKAWMHDNATDNDAVQQVYMKFAGLLDSFEA
jgi:myo-inositol catabolism protein IolC